jgi:hypothetical protein
VKDLPPCVLIDGRSIFHFGTSGVWSSGVYKCCAWKYPEVLSLRSEGYLSPRVFTDGWSIFHFKTSGVWSSRVYECCSCKYPEVLSLQSEGSTSMCLVDGRSKFHFDFVCSVFGSL